MVDLTEEQKNLLKKYIESFKDSLEQELSGKWKQERTDREQLFSKHLSESNIDNLSEDNFRELLKSLWSFRIWSNKDYKIDEILKDNGFQNIKSELKKLLHGKDSISKRFDTFKNNVKGLGPSSISELLVFMFPDKYCLCNRRLKEVLLILGMRDNFTGKFFKYSSITGEDYENCNELMQSIKENLVNSGFKDLDFLDVDIFIWILSKEVIEKMPKIPEKEKTKIEDNVIKEDEETDMDYIPPILNDLVPLSKNDPKITEKYENSDGMFEKKLWKLFKMLGFEVQELGHKKGGRVPDGVLIAQRNRYAILFDAKVREDGYSFGTDDRTIVEYIRTFYEDLSKKGIDKVFYVIVSSDFKGNFEKSFKIIKKETNIKDIKLLKTSVLLNLLETKFKNPQISTDELEDLFYLNNPIITMNDLQEVLPNYSIV